MIITLIETYDDRDEAVQAMYDYARRLRRRRVTDRYGVFIEKRQGVWWLNLKDRKAVS